MEAAAKTKNIIVFDGASVHDWPKLFAELKLPALPDGSVLRIVQTSWYDCEVTVYGDHVGPLLFCKPVRDSGGQAGNVVTVRPDFCLIRNQPRGPTPGSDKRNVLYGLICANVPSINTLMSEYLQLERPLMMGVLREIRDRVGQAAFPLNDITYFSSARGMVIAPPMPAVLKLSHAHAGQGKIRVETQNQFEDMRTVCALHDEYVSAEPFFPYDAGIRVQRCCGTYRVWEKIPTGAGWKSQFGGSDLREIPLTPMFKLWADECGKAFGGLDLFAVDALRKTADDGTVSYVIIELNGSACGFATSWEEDSITLAKEVHSRLSSLVASAMTSPRSRQLHNLHHMPSMK